MRPKKTIAIVLIALCIVLPAATAGCGTVSCGGERGYSAAAAE